MTTAGCPSGKVRHASERAAKAAATAVGRRRTHDRPRVYACDQCTGFHMTSARKQKTPRGGRQPLRPPVVATRQELDEWFAEHSRTPNGSRICEPQPIQSPGDETGPATADDGAGPTAPADRDEDKETAHP